MKIFGIAGWSNSGKTTLIAALVPALVARGISVSTVKHAGHGFDLDRPGKDSHRHREAGATEVMLASPERWALLHELRDEPEPDLSELLSHMTPVDLVLVEGFKRDPHDKIEVWRRDNGKPPLFADDPHVVAIVGDTPPGCTLPVIAPDNIEAVVDLIVERCDLAPAARRRA